MNIFQEIRENVLTNVSNGDIIIEDLNSPKISYFRRLPNYEQRNEKIFERAREGI